MISLGPFLVTAALLAPAAIASVEHQQGQPERNRVEADLRRYHVMVVAFREGSDAPVSEILNWSHSRIQSVLDAIGTGRDDIRPWEDARFEAAAFIHTDAAIRLMQADQDRALIHLDAATQVLHKGGPSLRRFTSRWYTAVARVLRDRNWLTVAEWLLQIGRHRLPNDAAVLFESGTLEELLATSTALPTERPPLPGESGPIAGEKTVVVTGITVEGLKQSHMRRLNDAAEWLRRSRELDSSSLEASLHLGRVESLRGKYDTAHRLFTEVERCPQPQSAYLAKLLQGAAFERQGRLADAVNAYRAAIAIVPSAQVAFVALSKSLQDLGRAPEARDVLSRGVDGVEDTRDEPWWSYFFERHQDALRRVDDLRREVQQ